MSNVVIIDVETSATKPQDSIVSIGAISTNNPEGRSYMMKPRFPISAVGLACHGIFNSTVENYVPPKVAIEYMLGDFPELLDPATYVMGWNVGFDKDALNAEFEAAGVTPLIAGQWVDLMTLAQKRIKSTEIGNYKLDTVYCHLFGDDEDKIRKMFSRRAAHDALEDVKLTKEVMDELMLEGETVEAMVAFLAEPMMLEVMPFGKYKDQPIGNLAKDMGYLRWLCTQCDIAEKYPDLIYTLKTLGLIQ